MIKGMGVKEYVIERCKNRHMFYRFILYLGISFATTEKDERPWS